jgi:glycosidase
VEHRDLIRELVSLRKQHKLLQTGEFAWLDASEDVIAFSRYSHQGKLGIWINLSDEEYSIPQDCCLEPCSALVM